LATIRHTVKSIPKIMKVTETCLFIYLNFSDTKINVLFEK